LAPVAAATALTIPGSVRLKYTATGQSRNMDYHARSQLDWLQDGEAYQASMVIGAPGLGRRSMASSGRITGDGLAPTRFLDKSRSERAAHFQPDKGKISFSANTPDAPWLAGAQDRLSVFVQLASLLAGDPAKYPNGSSVSLYTAGPTSADTWTFVVEAEERLSLPAGELVTLKLTRKPQRDYDQTVEVWLGCRRAPGSPSTTVIFWTSSYGSPKHRPERRSAGFRDFSRISRVSGIYPVALEHGPFVAM
jgi:Protein of unknown function (DUF3108)